MLLLLFMLTTLEAKTKYKVTVTAYNSSKKQCEGDPFLSATGYKLTKKDKLRTVAVSRDLFKKFKNRKAVLKIGKKTYYVKIVDTMHPRFKNKVDLYHYLSHREAIRFGKKHGQLIIKG